MNAKPQKLRLATVWLGGCSGCHMSFLDLDEELMALSERVDLVYGPLVDAKIYPENVDLCLVEGAITNVENLELARRIRTHTKTVVSFGDCAVTGNVTSMRNRISVKDLLTAVYHEARAPIGPEALEVLPALLTKVLPLHRAIQVDVFLPGCPPVPERISATLTALIEGRAVELPPSLRTFG
ncbi:NAD(P)-dependent nickel-iron dehydrogenase subunit HoxY [Geoalkalibacter ferrihydriticus]|nr:NADP oxidoreductase [Geoalkalibacter ferrihydriticus]SDL47542.1 NAD(P)-dependent nickel-iron dehydrogenase subunit HoxY [Geoalkalibacter ferrihydriticus]